MIVDGTQEIQLIRKPSTKICRINPNYRWEGDDELTINDCRQAIDCDYLNLINYISENKIEISLKKTKVGFNIALYPSSSDINTFLNINRSICI